MTCTWTDPADAEKIDPVLKQFQEYCEPKKNLSFERYCFNQRQQQPEELYDQYNSALKKLAEGCAFSIASITPDKILRDRLVFGIADDKVRERQLRESDLTLKKTDKLCHAAERMTAQLKVVVDKEATTEAANAVSTGRNTSKTKTQTTRGRRRKEVDCSGYCGQRHELNRDACPTYGKTCTNCGRKNYVASKCKIRTPTLKKSLHNANERDMTNEVFQTGTAHLDESELITLRLESGNYLRFQPDTGAQCNVILVSLYKKATRDFKMENVNSIQTPLVAYGGT